MALFSGQAGLRGSQALPPQHTPNGQAEIRRQVIGLIETACEPTHRVERHRHRSCRSSEQVSAGIRRQFRQ